MKKPMEARYAGKCSCCGAAFPKGASILWNGQATLAACAEREAAELAAEDAANAARYAKDVAELRAGLRVRTSPSLPTEAGTATLLVTGALNGKMARAEAEAFVASVTAATGTKARLVGHTRNGKRYVGRELVTYYGMSTIGYHEGWSFPWRMAS